MKKENFTPTTLSFEDIIDNSKKYYVPKYQRDYSWNNANDEWELLWEDIISPSLSHYVGILVLQENENEISIIDGQQRLTTISLIILSALYILSEYSETKASPKEKTDIQEQLRILMDKYIGKKAEDLKYYNKVSLNINNRNYFADICNINEYKYFRNVPEDRDLQTNSYIYKCLKYFYQNLKRYLGIPNPANIIQFLKNNIVNKLIFTTIQVSKNENAYLLFETLNSRSIELTAYDMLKNHLLSKAGQEYEDSMLEDLNIIVTKIGNHDITNFISLDWNSRHTPKIPQKRTYRIISSVINECTEAFSYVRELKNSSIIYEQIKNYDHEDKEIKELLKILTYLPRVKQHYMILLALMKTDKYSLKKILGVLLNLTIRYNYIAQGQANKQESIYNRIAYKIYKQEYAFTNDIINELQSSDLEVTNEEFISKFSKKNFANESLDRFILAKIEESYTPHIKIDYDNESIEHIADRNSEVEYLNRIGNLTLLTVDDNNSLSGKSYEAKRTFYQEHPRYIVNMIDNDIWNEHAVEERSKKLAEVANNIFK